jgi:hypothetical protein
MSAAHPAFDSSLPAADWRARRDAYRERVRPWVEDRLRRAPRGEKHPVHDFLFEYYAFRPAHLMRWSPGVGVRLENASVEDTGWAEFVPCGGGVVLPAAAFPAKRLDYLRWAVGYLEATLAREPAFGCFGLHEWAMVYRTDEVRHGRVPLRLTADGVADVVESLGLHCTHYDAFRFFTPAAAPRNRHALERATTDQFDQPGCVHVAMDLYKFAYKAAPWLPAEWTADAFELAWRARELDMRASPYDLRDYGYEPVRIETAAGRAEYAAAQQALSRAAVPVRAKLLRGYLRLRYAVKGP